jgi:hypothetical protein
MSQADIKEHMEVIGVDGVHVGTVAVALEEEESGKPT